MPSNTKLNAHEKVLLKDFRENQANLPRGQFEVFHYPENRVTVGVKYAEGDNAARIFVSLASPDETKFRKKVGEYNVRYGFDDYLSGLTSAGIPFYIPEIDRDIEGVHQAIADLVAMPVGFQE